MKIIRNFFLQLRSIAPITFSVYILILLLLAAIKYLSVKQNIPIDHFLRDPVAVMEVHPFTGIFSNIGILFWCSTAAICFYCSAVIKRKTGDRKLSFFLFCAGIITSILLLDDMLMFHETVFPDFFHIPEKVIYLVYLSLILTFLIKFRNLILKTEFLYLFLAFCFFGSSIGLDMVQHIIPRQFLFEDILKLFGIYNWFLYFAIVCFQNVKLQRAEKEKIELFDEDSDKAA